MMLKSAKPGEGGGGVHALPLSLYLPSLSKVVVCASDERADTLPLISPLPLYVLCG
jgi:hypothetical protein